MLSSPARSLVLNDEAQRDRGPAASRWGGRASGRSREGDPSGSYPHGGGFAPNPPNNNSHPSSPSRKHVTWWCGVELRVARCRCCPPVLFQR